MKKLAHYLEIRVFEYPTEDSEKIKKALVNILGIDEEEIEEKIEKEEVESQHGARIVRYDYKTERWSEVKDLMKKIFDQVKKPENLNRYLNEEGDFFIRLDKQKAYEGEIEPSESGDVIHVKVKIASYPFNQEQVRENLEELITQGD